MKLSLSGAQRYWFHGALIALFRERTRWDENQIKEFLAANEQVHFNHIQAAEACRILEDLEAGGFEVQTRRVKGDLVAHLSLPYPSEFQLLKKELAVISARLHEMEERGTGPGAAKSVRESAVYQELRRASASGESRRAAAPSIPKNTAEGNIGKYWLSRIGIFTLVLGLVLFISYSFQFIGAWGKICTGAGIGAALIALGNLLAPKEDFRKWAMALIGGGWAVLYFTVFAAYQIPVTRVIYDPLLGFAGLLAVAGGSIAQSLKFRSGVLVCFSYFLAYVAITMVEVSYYTLGASVLLALSIIVVTRKMGWSWLALLGLAAVYLIHWFWLEPNLYGTARELDESSWWDALVLPWAGEEWRIYPLIQSRQSILHQGFLAIYWLLFALVGLTAKREPSEKEEFVSLAVLLANNFLFTACYVHHLHVHYPAYKYVFPLVMAAVFWVFCVAEQRLGRRLFADLYLAFSVTLLCLAVPMYFDGPWITYGWCAAAACLAWIGVRHERKVLRVIAWVLAGVTAWRLTHCDYLEREVLFSALMPVRSSLVLFAAAAVAWLAVFRAYSAGRLAAETEKRVAENVFLIAAALALAFGALVGGFRQAASVVWVLEGAALMAAGMKWNRFSLRAASAVFMFFAAVRLASVDYVLELARALTAPRIALRLAVSGAAVFVLLHTGDSLRRKFSAALPKDLSISRCISAAGAVLILFYFYDTAIGSWISIVWGAWAFAFIILGFVLRDKPYRWIGLGLFGLVLARLFFHDFSKLETLYRIASFIGLGAVFIAAGFLYSYYSRILLSDDAGK
ncbi:MAG: DUF2339 domain-containing protein [Candidatus Omnitrophica bacterium]|nr:DUF2339 domain-containing protein [Candidatus Omnitrophota bacterium]